jgi:hypothetical protein
MNLQSVYGLFAQGVIVAALIRFVRMLTGHAKAKPHGIELWLPVMLLLAGSAEGVTFAGHLRGLWGDPASSLCCCCSWSRCNRRGCQAGRAPPPAC